MIMYPRGQDPETGAVMHRRGYPSGEVTGAMVAREQFFASETEAVHWNLSRASLANTRSVKHNRAIILVALELIDEMEATLKYAFDERLSFFAGIRSIHQRFLRLLADDDVIPFESIGMPFDHNLHEAVQVEREVGREPGRITEEFRRGYTQGGIVVRPARVRVAGW